MAKLSEADEKRIKANSEAWFTADDAEKKRLHDENEAIRAGYGYSGGADGSQNIKLSNGGGDWIGNSEKLAQTQNLNGSSSAKTNKNNIVSNNDDYASELNRLKRLQQEATASQLKAQKERTLQSLAEQEASIQPRYYEQKRQAGATSALGAKSFAEYLANRGLTNSGAAAQGEINRQAALQGTLGQLGTAEAQDYAQIARARQSAEQNHASDLASANAQLEANYYNNLIEENQRQRQIDEQLKQQALGQYSDDYMARRNELIAQGYSPDSREVMMVDAARGQKLANAQSGANYNWAMQQILNGNINYNTALNAGMTVQQAQEKYNEYQAQLQAEAQAEADRQAFADYIKQVQLNNAAALNNSNIAKNNATIANINDQIAKRGYDGTKGDTVSNNGYMTYENAKTKVDNSMSAEEAKIKADELYNTGDIDTETWMKLYDYIEE